MRIGATAILITALILAGCAQAASTSPATGTPTFSSAAPPSLATTAAAPASSSPSRSAEAALLLLALGDSIAYNSPNDCPGCTGFVSRYSDALAGATGMAVKVRNASQHNGLQIDGLLADLDGGSYDDVIASADAILVGIAHNDVPMNRDDDSCDGRNSDTPDWSKYTGACVAAEIARFKPKYERAFARIAELRAGKPTILRATNRYNDWIGWPANPVSSAGVAATARVIAAWNDMLCGAAEAAGFVCADISKAFNGKSGTDAAGDLLANDYTHPSDKGNVAIAQVLVDLGFAPLVP